MLLHRNPGNKGKDAEKLRGVRLDWKKWDVGRDSNQGSAFCRCNEGTEECLELLQCQKVAWRSSQGLDVSREYRIFLWGSITPLPVS